MKKFLVIVSLLVCSLMLFACADNKETPGEKGPNGGQMKVAPLTVDVYVTIANKGELPLKQSKITATDLNDDKKVDLDEVFVATHQMKYNGENGYTTSESQWGLSIATLWGDTSGFFGYYINNVMSMGLSDEVKNGDYVDAYVMQYKNSLYDTYTFFDVREATAVKGGEFELTLSYVGFDDSWNPVNYASAGSSIVVNGEKTSSVTDANGRVKLSFANAGTYVISATSEAVTMVPPVCVVTVK